MTSGEVLLMSVSRTSVLFMLSWVVKQYARWPASDAAALAHQELITTFAEVVQARAVLDGVASRMIGEIERRELAKQFGATSTGAWLTGSARIDAGPARRMVATAAALDSLLQVSAQLGVGEISVEHAEAIAGSVAAIDTACPNLPEVGREVAVQTLLDVALADPPAAVRRKGRELLLALHPPELGDDPAEDTDRNRFDVAVGRNGRGMIRGDLDAATYEKLLTALNPLSKPRPESDGVRDARTASQRRADRFADLLDAYLGSGVGPTEGGVRPHLTLTASARDLAGCGAFIHDLDDPDPETTEPDRGSYEDLFVQAWPFQLAWMGPLSAEAAQMLACDCDLTRIILDGKEVPLNVGRTERVIGPYLRKALVVRDHGCAMPGCGRPAAWCEGHHIVPWAQGGETKLSNLVLLCRVHHAAIHKALWEVFLGDDDHPWFIPPPMMDPQRRPVPANNRRGTRAAA